MTGVSLDLFTVILMIILAFICGYSSGHKLGREEIRRWLSSLGKAMANGPKNPGDIFSKMLDDKNKGDKA